MIGEKIGHFTIKRKLGEGKLGTVYLAEHDVMHKKVAIKILLPQWTQSTGVLQRFRNEAIAMASLQHPNIVDVIDCGQLASGAWYILMEYLEGSSLSQFCAMRGPLSVYVALQILCQVAAALEAAHKHKIVHRGLKPENIFLITKKANPYFVKVLDWGIAKLGEPVDNDALSMDLLAGGPAYMAPEQLLDLRSVDRRTDVFALGAIAYWLLTGWLPFQRLDRPHEFATLDFAAIHELQMREAPTPLRQHVASIGERIEGVLLAALHRDPARRPRTARQFILLLATAIPGDGFNRPGVDIVKAYAEELLEIGNLEETLRAVKPREKRVSSRYRLGDKLGAGGMAEVFRATQTGAEGFTRQVAVKRVLPGLSSTPQFASMFVQEAKLASLLDHPNIVSVLDFDRDEEGRLFLAMEYIEGCDLATLARTGRLPISLVIYLVGEVLSGLGYAHNLPLGDGPCGLIHRDVSPHNVLVSWEGAVKVSDFGIAKARHASVATASEIIKGKPQYMSPEQARGEALDGRSDLFAIGVMLWELLTGKHLFEGTTQEALAQIFFQEIPPPSTVAFGVPHDLDVVTMQLLTRDKEARYATAEQAIEDLARCADAPRNGRAELARLLAERFPASNAARRSRTQLSAQRPSQASQISIRGSINSPYAATDTVPIAATDTVPIAATVRLPAQHDKALYEVLLPKAVPAGMGLPAHGGVTLRDGMEPRAAAAGRAQQDLALTERGVSPLPEGPVHTTLSGAASQLMGGPGHLRRDVTILAGVFLGVATLTGFGVYATTRKSRRPGAQGISAVPLANIKRSSVNQVPETALTVTTDPAGAAVCVDGLERGVSPLTLRVPRGREVTIDVGHDGYAPERQIVETNLDRQSILLKLHSASPGLHGGRRSAR